MIKVLFVCLGNICRSPMAEAIFRSKVEKKGLISQFEIASCGTSNYHIGDNADPRTIKTAKDNGVDMSHCVRQLTTVDFERFDFILVMDKTNLSNTLRLANTDAQRKKVFLMRDFDNQGPGLEVPDPYYGTAKSFQEVFNILDRATDAFLKSVL